MEVANLDIEVREKLDNHEERIKDLEINYTKTNEQLKYMREGQDELKQELKDGLQRLENTTLSNYNSMLSMLGQLVINKDNNKNKLYIQLIITFGALLGGILAGVKLF